LINLIISITGKKIGANKNVLAIGSDFLKYLLIDYQSSAFIPEIYLPDCNGEMLERIVQFLYSGIIDISPADMSEFVEFVNLLEIKGSIDCVGSFNGSVKVTGQYKSEEFSNQTETTIEPTTSQKIHNKIQLAQQKLADTSKSLDHLVADLSENENEENLELEITKNDKDRDVIFYEIQEISEDVQEEGEEYLVDIDPNEKNENNMLQDKAVSSNEKALMEAMDEILNKRLSFHQAAEKYDISKTYLWRKAKKMGYSKSVRPKSEQRLLAIEEIKNGESLLNVSKKYNIPISTLHREKTSLFNQGNLPINVSNKIRKRGVDFSDRLRKAICDILNGKSQNEAAKSHDIPKATVWRIMKKVDSSSVTLPLDPYSCEMDKIMDSCTAYSKRKIKNEPAEKEIYLIDSDGTLKLEQDCSKGSEDFVDESEMTITNKESESLNSSKRKRKQTL
jgi:predicted DNA-binding protein (UPF0251 family)